MSALAPFAAYLEAFGLPILEVPVEHPDHPVPEGPRAVLHLAVPLDQADALLEADGWDPSEPGAPPLGGEARRLLSSLRRAGLIEAWHAFEDAEGAPWCHVLLTGEQPRLWYTAIDWEAKTTESGRGRPEHAFA
jgi:hypothetical protein